MNREQRREAEQRGESTEPTTEELAAADERFEQLKVALRGNALQAVFQGLEGHKKRGDPEPLQEATIGFAINVFFHFLKKNNLVRLGTQTDACVALALQAIPGGAAEALKKIEDRRIVIPGR